MQLTVNGRKPVETMDPSNSNQKPNQHTWPRFSRQRLGACLLALAVTCAFWSPRSGFAQDAEERRDQIFNRSEGELLDYMKESVLFVAQGHELAYKGFASWYVNDLLPGQDGAPGIEKVFRYLVEELLLAGVAEIIPHKGIFVVDVLHGFSRDAYAELSASMGGVGSQQGFLQTLDLQLAQYKSDIIALPHAFEEDHPGRFEEAMFQYLNEEVETPGIHEASDFDLGSSTRELLHDQGFPEPSRASIDELAERLLIAMVLEAKKKYNSEWIGVLDEGQLEIDARISALRVLYPNQPDRYCRGAGMLGMLAPKDCR